MSWMSCGRWLRLWNRLMQRWKLTVVGGNNDAGKNGKRRQLMQIDATAIMGAEEVSGAVDHFSLDAKTIGEIVEHRCECIQFYQPFKCNSLSWFVETCRPNVQAELNLWTAVNSPIEVQRKSVKTISISAKTIDNYVYHLFAELNSSNWFCNQFHHLKCHWRQYIGVDSSFDRICLCYWEKPAETNRIFWATNN